MPAYPKGSSRSQKPNLDSSAHLDLFRAIAGNRQLLGGQNFVYILDAPPNGTVIKFTDCLATKLIFESLKESPCVGLPEIYDCYGDVADWDGRTLSAFKLKLYQVIAKDDVERASVKAVCDAVDDAVEAQRRADASNELDSKTYKERMTAAHWAKVCSTLQSNAVISQNNLSDCFARMSEILRQAGSSSWSVDSSNHENLVMEPGGQLIFVDPF